MIDGIFIANDEEVRVCDVEQKEQMVMCMSVLLSRLYIHVGFSSICGVDVDKSTETTDFYSAS